MPRPANRVSTRINQKINVRTDMYMYENILSFATVILVRNRIEFRDADI